MHGHSGSHGKRGCVLAIICKVLFVLRAEKDKMCLHRALLEKERQGQCSDAVIYSHVSS